MNSDAKADQKHSIIEFQKLSSILLIDIERANKSYLASPKSQTAARNLVRIIFASIEGQTFALKQWSLNTYRLKNKIAQPGELALLEDVSYELNESGNIKKRTLRLPTAANVRFAFESMARAHDINFEFNSESLGWKSLKNALQVRHRLTHPKSSWDLLLEKDDVNEAIVASAWFNVTVLEILMGCLLKLCETDKSLIKDAKALEVRLHKMVEERLFLK